MRWPLDGVPRRPGAWLTTVAANRARDAIRREAALRRRLPLLVAEETEPSDTDPAARGRRPAPAGVHVLSPGVVGDAQVALTLRLVCGLSTAEVARAFLVQEATMAARITRAKKKIAAARIPYRVPSRAELPERLGPVLDVVYLVFTTGHAAPSGDALVRDDLVDRALDLGRFLHRLLPDERGVAGLLALMLLVDARRDTRMDADGNLALLADQDRSRWDRAEIEEGVALLTRSLSRSEPDRYAVEAAVAAVHAEAPRWADTDWDEVVRLYDVLLRLRPSPVVALNRAAAIGLRDGPQAGLDALEVAARRAGPRDLPVSQRRPRPTSCAGWTGARRREPRTRRRWR